MASTPRTRETSPREDVRSDPAPRSHGRTRVRRSDDKFFVDPAIIPPGWHYQWKRHTILGQEDPAYQAELHQVGFSPVPAERHPGVFLPAGATGSIIIGGQMLMERPIELENEARFEEKQRADAQVNGSRQQFGLPTNTPGFSTQTPGARANTYVRSGYERVDVAGPQHQLAVDE